MDLTTYELLDVVASWKADTALGMSSLVSVFSAYLLVAYFAGAKLSRAQVLIVSGLTVWFAAIAIFQISINLRSLAEFNTYDVEEYGANADLLISSIVVRWAIVSGCIASLVASLFFMWSVRHPKTE
jgi:hypothetical protein